MQAITEWSKSVRVEVRGDDVVGHAGNVVPRMLADNLGLTSGLSGALSRPEVTHDRGAVIRDVAVAIAGGAENLAGTAVLRNQARLFGPVASTPTLWRSLNEIDHAGLARIALVRNKVRQRVWELIEARHGAIPPSRTCYGDLGDVIVIRIDASLIDSHSDKECAAGNFKGGYGFHPLLAFCDNTGELLAVIPRKGNAGSNTASDHIAIIDAAIAAIPAKWRKNLLITIDGAGSSHDVVDHLTKLNARPGWSVAYSVGFGLDERVRTAIGQMPAHGWSPALDAAGRAREDAQVAELTGLLRESTGGDRLDGWPKDMRILVRREKIEVGAQLSLFEQLNGFRYQITATATRGGQRQLLEAPIGCTPAWKGSSAAARTPAWPAGPRRRSRSTPPGSPRSPSRSTCCVGCGCCCSTAHYAKAEPTTLRYRLLHAAARLVRRSRYLILRIPESWPWAKDFADAVNRVQAIP